MYLYNKKYIYNFNYKNVVNVKNKYNKYKLYLIYNSKSNFFWVNIIKKNSKKINNKKMKYRKQFII